MDPPLWFIIHNYGWLVGYEWLLFGLRNAYDIQGVFHGQVAAAAGKNRDDGVTSPSSAKTITLW